MTDETYGVMPGSGNFRRILAAMLAAAALAGAVPAIAAPEQGRPYSCRLLDDEQRKCAFGQCDARTIERLRKECLRDGGRP
jgi:hypothetical protein